MNDHGSGPKRAILGFLAIILLLPFVFRVFQQGLGHVGCESTWDDGVAEIARAAHNFALGAPLYSDFRKAPYYTLGYTPLLP
jgi:hypothetical protein